MDRRRFVTVVAGTCLLAPLTLRAQQPGKIFRIGLLVPATGPTSTIGIELEALRAGLRDLGWVEGKNIIIETRWAGANPQRQRELAAELRSLPVTLILALGTTGIAAARDGAPGLPVVMINAGDPVGAKFVASLARPGGDLTGTSAAGEELLPKQLELLSAAVPNLKRVGVLMNSANPANGFFFDAMSLRAKTLGLSVDRVDVATEDELDGAIARAEGGALVVVSDPMFLRRRDRIIELTFRSQVPSAFGRREYVAAGGLMSYVSSSTWHWRSAASFVDKILKGARPADIPVEQPTQFELVINLKTAKSLGLTIPQSLLQRSGRSDRVAESSTCSRFGPSLNGTVESLHWRRSTGCSGSTKVNIARVTDVRWNDGLRRTFSAAVGKLETYAGDVGNIPKGVIRPRA